MSEALYHNPPPSRSAYNISGKPLPPLQTRQDELVVVTDSGATDLIADGARLFRQCASCHGISEQGPNRVGPSLWNIVDRPVASLGNYRYSRALQELGQKGAIWDEEWLDAYIEAPAQTIPGTTMAFRGVNDRQARSAIIAYLRSLISQVRSGDD